MPGKLDGKVAIVTASSEGIGLSIAKRLARDGAAVVVSSRKQTKVDEAVRQIEADGGKVFGMVCHVGKPEHRTKLIEETVARFGGIDILVSNAASNPTMGAIFDMSESAYDKIFDTNVKSTFFLCKEAVPYMEKRGGGSIIIVSSVGGYSLSEVIGIYTVSKTTLFGLIKAMVPQCAGMNIRVNGIAPGLIRTNFSGALWQNPDIERIAIAGIPMGRIGEPDEMAGVVTFLASDDSSYITGETIVLAGGQQSRL